MKFPQATTQYKLSSFAAVVGLLIIAGATIWKNSCFSDALLSNERSLIVPTMILLVVSLGSLTDVAVDEAHSRPRAVAWLVGMFLLMVVIVSYLAWHCINWYVVKEYLVPREVDVTALSFFLAVLFLFVMAFTMARLSTPLPDELFERWGKIASLIIMILALFAFGLRFDEHNNSLEMHWAELPAILIVFVLAELGVTLVVTSKRIDRNVEKSAGVAKEAVANSTALSQRTTKLVREGNQLAEKLEKLSNLASMVDSGCYIASVRLCDQMGMAETSETRKYWDKIGVFARSWDPEAPGDEGTKKLLRILFESYVGHSVLDGSVRQKQGSVTCITTDSVFADASEKWLKEMRALCDADRTLVVWAVTRLLPTEFAFPAIWLGTDTLDHRAGRVQSLERFISSVISTCKDTKGDVEYRRVTVFDDAQEFEDYRGPCRGRGSLGQAALEKLADGVMDEDLLSNSLDNWMLWDPRANRGTFVQSEEIFRVTTRVVHELLTVAGKAEALDDRSSLRWSKLKQLISEQSDISGSNAYRSRLLPCFLVPNPDKKEVFVFDTEFAESREASNHDTLERLKGAVLGSSKWFLDCVPSAEAIARADVSDNIRRRLSDFLKANGTVKTRQLLQVMGWRSLRQWYCSSLHTRTKAKSEAWWAVKKDDGNFNDEFFRPLQLTWNGASVLTLDALLIGSRTKGALAANTEWHGAVISNVSSRSH